MNTCSAKFNDANKISGSLFFSFEMRIILKILDENLKPSLNQIIDSFLISYREKILIRKPTGIHKNGRFQEAWTRLYNRV